MGNISNFVIWKKRRDSSASLADDAPPCLSQGYEEENVDLSRLVVNIKSTRSASTWRARVNLSQTVLCFDPVGLDTESFFYVRKVVRTCLYCVMTCLFPCIYVIHMVMRKQSLQKRLQRMPIDQIMFVYSIDAKTFYLRFRADNEATFDLEVSCQRTPDQQEMFEVFREKLKALVHPQEQEEEQSNCALLAPSPEKTSMEHQLNLSVSSETTGLQESNHPYFLIADEESKVAADKRVGGSGTTATEEEVSLIEKESCPPPLTCKSCTSSEHQQFQRFHRLSSKKIMSNVYLPLLPPSSPSLNKNRLPPRAVKPSLSLSKDYFSAMRSQVTDEDQRSVAGSVGGFSTTSSSFGKTLGQEVSSRMYRGILGTAAQDVIIAARERQDVITETVRLSKTYSTIDED